MEALKDLKEIFEPWDKEIGRLNQIIDSLQEMNRQWRMGQERAPEKNRGFQPVKPVTG